MALPSSGQITYSAINTEAGLTSNTSNTSVNDRINTYNKELISTNQSPTYFYGITWDSINSTYGNISTTTNTSTEYAAYRSITHSGQNSSSSLAMTISVSCTTPGNGEWRYYYSINSTSSWTQFAYGTGTSSSSSYRIPSTGDLTIYDTLRVRVYTSHQSGAGFAGNISISAGKYVTGGGAWSKISTYSWNWSHL